MKHSNRDIATNQTFVRSFLDGFSTIYITESLMASWRIFSLHVHTRVDSKNEKCLDESVSSITS